MQLCACNLFPRLCCLIHILGCSGDQRDSVNLIWVPVWVLAWIIHSVQGGVCSCKWQTHTHTHTEQTAGLPLMSLSGLSQIVLVLKHPFPPAQNSSSSGPVNGKWAEFSDCTAPSVDGGWDRAPALQPRFKSCFEGRWCRVEGQSKVLSFAYGVWLSQESCSSVTLSFYITWAGVIVDPSYCL